MYLISTHVNQAEAGGRESLVPMRLIHKALIQSQQLLFFFFIPLSLSRLYLLQHRRMKTSKLGA